MQRISTRTNSENNNKVNKIVEEILQEVKDYGDFAVEKYTKKFDGFNPSYDCKCSDLKDAWDELDSNLKSSLNLVKELKNSMKRKFHHLSPLKVSMVI